MILFFDTSSLFKLYHNEEGSEQVISLLASQEIEKLYLSEIAKVEFFSAAAKKLRTNEIAVDDFATITSAFQKDFEKYSFILLDSALLAEALNLVKKYKEQGLRTLDSIQLASLLKVRSIVTYALTDDSLFKKIIANENIATI